MYAPHCYITETHGVTYAVTGVKTTFKLTLVDGYGVLCSDTSDSFKTENSFKTEIEEPKLHFTNTHSGLGVDVVRSVHVVSPGVYTCSWEPPTGVDSVDLQVFVGRLSVFDSK